MGQQLATVTIFLNDLGDEEGGELVFPSANPPVRIRPKKGMAVVHHNLNEDHTIDPSSIHAELPFHPSKGSGGASVKWTAKRWIYTDPIPTARKVILPVMAAPFGGRLPGVVRSLHQLFVDKFDADSGGKMFDQFLMSVPVLLLLILASFITSVMSSSSTSASSDGSSSSKKKGKSPAKQSKKSTKKKIKAAHLELSFKKLTCRKLK